MAELPAHLEDDLIIAGEVRLLRRVPMMWVAANGAPDRSNFQHKSNENSGWSCTLWDSDVDLYNLTSGHTEFGVVRIKAEAFRQFGLQIARVPIDGNPNHCEVFGPMTSKSQAGKLRDQCVWVKYPPSVPDAARGPLETFELRL